MVVGWTHVGDLNTHNALVDTGTTATLMMPDVVRGGTQLEKTTVQLRTVTGEVTPMLGKGRVTLNVGGLSVTLPVRVVEVQDSCILGLDFLRLVCGVLDPGENTLSFPGGPTVKITFPAQKPRLHQLAVKATEARECTLTTPAKGNSPSLLGSDAQQRSFPTLSAVFSAVCSPSLVPPGDTPLFYTLGHPLPLPGTSSLLG